MTNFQVGDRVECIYDDVSNRLITPGLTGTICRQCGDNQYVAVCWDEDVEGHDCIGHCEYGYGWNVSQNIIRLTESEPPELTIDDSELCEFLSGFAKT